MKLKGNLDDLLATICGRYVMQLYLSTVRFIGQLQPDISTLLPFGKHCMNAFFVVVKQVPYIESLI